MPLVKIRGGRHGAGVFGLIDVAEADVVIEECADGFFREPTAVAHFGDQRKFVKRAAQADQEFAVFGREAEGPGELHQTARQLPRTRSGHSPSLNSAISVSSKIRA